MTTSGWALRRTVDPEIEPVTLEEARSQCQIDADLTIHDSDLNRYIKAARILAEEYTKRSFIEQEWRISGSRFSSGCDWDEYGLELPMGPVLRVRSITYLDNDGNRVAMAESDYSVLTDEEPCRVFPAYNTTWPSGRYYPGAVQIDYVAGYPSAGSPADAANVPEIARQAILMLVAHWFNAREEADKGNQASIPYGFERSLDPLKVYP